MCDSLNVCLVSVEVPPPVWEMMPVEFLSWLRVDTVRPSFYFRKTKQEGIVHIHEKDRIGALCLLQD